MRLDTAFVACAFAIAGALALASCKESTSSGSCGSGTPPSLVGTYVLDAYTLGTNTVPAPPASGSLQFTATKYYATISVPNPAPPPTSITTSDSGTYAIQGSACISQNSQTGQPQFVGTFTLTGTTFTVTGTAGGQAAGSVWTKQ